MEEKESSVRFSSRQFEKFADWCERAALISLGSLVLQQVKQGIPLRDPSIIIGIFATAVLYFAAYRLIKNSS